MKRLFSALLPVLNRPTKAPALGQVKMYFKPNGKLYQLNAKDEERQIDEQTHLIELTNGSSMVLAPGHIVVLNRASPMTCATTDVFYSSDVLGVVREGGSPSQKVVIQFAGVVDVWVTGAYDTNVGDYVYTSNVHGIGGSNAAPYFGIIGRAMTFLPAGASGKVKVILSGGLPELY